MATAWVLIVIGSLPGIQASASESKPVTADVLPTWQTNGPVWALEEANGVVFVGGDFTAVRPPGAALGVQEVPREKFAAFEAATGDLLPCAPSFTIGTGSATIRAIEASPDESRVYIGGSFGKVSGVGVANLVSLDTSSCTLTPTAQFRRPSVTARVLALNAAEDRLYVAGQFKTADSQTRSRFAVFTDKGILTPTAATFDATTRAVLAAPEAGRVYVGGDFNNVNGVAARAIVAIDATTGSTVQTFPGWMPSTSVTKALVRDGDRFYLGAEGTGSGVFDGRLAADLATGELIWKDTCLGATQALAVRDGLLYSASHAHDCSSTPGGFRDSGFRQHLLAQNQSDKVIRHWFPDTDEGFDMGVAEALGPRAMVFAGDDLWVGGEFTRVNDFNVDGPPQWGLVRFAGSPDTGTNYSPALSVSSTVRGKVNVRWMTDYDRDDETLIYELYRDGSLVDTQASASKEWDRPVLSYTDLVTPDTTVTYRMRVLEADGENWGPLGASYRVDVSNTTLPYAGQILSDGATHYWRLGDALGSTTAADAAASDASQAGIVTGDVTFGSAGAIQGVSDTAASFGGSRTTISSPTTLDNPTTYSLEAWFRTSTNTGGKLIGFGNKSSGNSSNYDRHIYMTNSGQLIFGAWTGSPNVAQTSAKFNDGRWHHLVGTQGASGMALYVDGDLAATNPQTAAQPYTGYWRIGGDSVSGWPGAPSSQVFNGDLDEVAVYDGKILTPTQIKGHFAEGNPASDTTPPTIPGSLTAQISDGKVDLTWTESVDDGRIASYQVHRSTTSGFTPDASTLLGTTEGASFTDSSPLVGKQYYRVLAVDTAGNSSLASDPAWVTAVAPTVDLIASADTYTSSTAKTSNYGTKASLATYGSPDVATYLRFTLPSIPDTQTIAKATLLVRTTTLATAGTADTTRVQLAGNTWDEYSVLYADRPSMTDQVFGSLPGGSSPDTAYSIQLESAQVASHAGEEITLALVGTGTDSLWLTSREATKGKPTLRLEYQDEDVVNSDTEPPTVPAGVTAAFASGQVQVAWHSCTDNVGVTAYDIFRGTRADFVADNASKIGSRAGNSLTDSTPAVGNSYYKIVAVDGAGNRSNVSDAVRVFVPASSSTVVASADTYTSSSARTTNYGKSSSLASYGTPDVTSYMRFAIPEVPAGHRISSVMLNLRTTAITGAGTVDGISVKLADNDWDESTVVYDSRPALATASLGTLAGATNPDSPYSVRLDAIGFSGKAGQEVTLALIGTGADSLWITSRESSKQNPNLVFDYEPAE